MLIVRHHPHILKEKRPLIGLLVQDLGGRLAGAMAGFGFNADQDGVVSRMRFLQPRSEEHTFELQSLMRISKAVFCLKKNNKQIQSIHIKIPITEKSSILNEHEHI